MWPDTFLELVEFDWLSRLTAEQVLSILWVHPATREQATFIERAIAKVSGSLQERWPEVIARELDLSERELRMSLYKIGRWRTVVLPELWSEATAGGDPVPTQLVHAGFDGPGQPRQVPEGELRAGVASAIKALDTTSQMLLAAYHYMHLTLHELGHAYGRADSAVPILYGYALLRTRAELPELAELADRLSLGASLGAPRELRRWCGTDGSCHALVGEPPFQMTLCGQRCADGFVGTHPIDACPRGTPLCESCVGRSDYGRPYGTTWPPVRSVKDSLDRFKALPGPEKQVVLLFNYEILDQADLIDAEAVADERDRAADFRAKLREIAEVLDTSPSEVYAIFQRAYRQLLGRGGAGTGPG